MEQAEELAKAVLSGSQADMDRLDRPTLATLLLQAPEWMRVDLSDRDQQRRERAADALAARIVEQLALTR